MAVSPIPASKTAPRSLTRRILIGVGALLAVAAAGALWIAATFDPNAWKPTIVEHVQQRYQRTLTLDGDIRISWFPSIGAEVGGASLSERGSSIEFAGAERVRVSLALLPLLRGRIVVEDLVLERPRATVVRRKDGSRNFDDLIDAASAEPRTDAASPESQAVIDIARIIVSHGRLTSRDEHTGQVFSVSALDLSTGRIGGNDTEPFSVSAVVQANDPALEVRIGATGRLLVDLDAGRYGTSGLVATVDGARAGTPLDARVEVARIFSGSRILELEKFRLVLRTGDAAQSTSVEASLPRLAAADGVFTGVDLAVVIDRKAPDTALNIRIGAPLQVRLGASGFLPERIDAWDIKADVEGRFGGRTVQGSARAELALDMASGRHQVPRFAVKGTLFGLDAPVRDIAVALDGAASFDTSIGALAANFDGRVNDSTVRANLERKASTTPLRFDAEADQLDVDRYRPAASAAPAKSAPGSPGKPGVVTEPPIDFSFLNDLAFEGTARVGALKVKNIRATNVRIGMKAAGGRLDFAPIVASLYSGSLEGRVGLSGAKSPRIAIRQRLSGVQLGPLLTDAAKLELIEGRGDVQLDVTAQGATVDAMMRALAGTASLSVANGALRGANIAGVLLDARTRIAQVRGREVLPAVATERTDFTALRASFVLRDGVARNSDLSMQSPLLRAGGEGAVDIGAATIDYLLRTTIVGSLAGQGGRAAGELRGVTVPIRISGPLDKPQFDFDLQSMFADTARKELQRRATDLLQERLGNKPGGETPGAPPAGRPSPADLLKGILGR